MRFASLLRALSLVLRVASKRNKAFQHYIGNVNIKIAIKTKDNKGRTFLFNRGRVSSSRSLKEYDAALVFSNPVIAFKVLKEGTQEASFYAAATGNLYIEGMAFFIQWFNDAVTIAMQKK
ncbi:MAG: hypothetical protein KBG92_03225 [Spirochaetes bacterium]|jgi:hypothetical protein|nr:hypothetical protein [Spirochaetota bacterium]MBP8986794.1 hypothetical protein [Spirochaetota bacterium]HOE19613.1 hypothetical protein [Spirochaetota bacterium]HQL43139.1 hypothetical protein [Spirochaetota bacterium]HQQ50628.1 hypothetical protein [Spirochaetota bacterium]